MEVEPKGKLIKRYLNEKTQESSLHDTIRVDEIKDPEYRERFVELCQACRSGDLEQVEKLVSFGAHLNAIDEFDYSPLILASLCGHLEVVKYLLEKGAVCDRDTFQGERCLYGALNDTIRQLLLKFDISKAVDTAQPFVAHVSSFLSKRPPLDTHDIEFVALDGAVFKLHRFILALQSDYFADHLQGAWKNKKSVELKISDSSAFNYVLRYIYLYDQLLPRDEYTLNEILKIARKLRLQGLVDDLEYARKDLEERAAKNRLFKSRDQRESDMWKARTKFELLLEKEVLGSRKTFGPYDDDLSQEDFEQFRNLPSAPDAILCLIIEHENDDLEVKEETVHYYPAHKTMLVRSEYYLTMFTSSFSEGVADSNQLPVITLPVANVRTAELVLTYLYTDRVTVPIEEAMNVMYAANLLLLDRLKSLAAITITNCGSNLPKSLPIYSVLRAGWTLRIDRLEKYVARLIADRLEEFVADERFKLIVQESAERIFERQETDTIELIDDIRYYLAKKYGIIFGDGQDADGTKELGKKVYDEELYVSQYEREYNSQLDLIDGLLGELNLEA
ncbi:hypothetical protein TRVA0_021S01046 [Trichomonascus vanleenenianus]|uniref:uncharacterized protein n=1 Tax=Trichomonascus vanleenenianus TaxID=2268995 RepID=UPI003ECB20D0